MIYAINKRTKEHVAHPDKRMHEVHSGVVIAEDGWDLVEADADGRIPWEGGECPLPEGVLCEVLLRDDGRTHKRSKEASEWAWNHSGTRSDIIAYRPILDAEPSEPEAPEWDGSGRPPAGSAFEFSANGVSWEERVMLFDDGITCLMAHGKYPANRWHYKCDDPDILFRPIRTPAQRAEDAMLEWIAHPSGERYAKIMARQLYAAIRDGKIPGVKLEGK